MLNFCHLFIFLFFYLKFCQFLYSNILYRYVVCESIGATFFDRRVPICEFPG